MTQDKWIFMPHAGHLIVSSHCQFHLNTYVGNFIVSTVGEWWPERPVREIHAQVHDPKWLVENQHLKGDYFDVAYMKRFGFEEIGADRLYETMVFKAQKEANPEYQCCPYTQISGESVDMEGYNDRAEAFRGHYELCMKYSKL